MLLASMVGMAAAAAERPRLVVGIVVEGLQNDYLRNLSDLLGEGGFKRLSRKGVVLSNADYGTYLDREAATAMIMTGAAPTINGIGSAYKYDVEGHRLVPVLYDQATIGNFTNETYSPKNLLVSTLADEVRIAGGGVTNVFAIAPDPQQSIILGGHAANSALWINDTNGNWATTTFYKDIPAFIGGRNRLAPLASRMDTMSWTPIIDVARYPDLPDHLKHYPFRYVYPRGNSDRFDMFKHSPSVNDEITAIADEFITTIGLGKHDGVDMLNVSYTLAPYDYSSNPDNRLEQMDAYLRLDRNLEKIFTTIDRATGGNALIFLAATPPAPVGRRDEERWNIPSGEFSTRRASSLLNMYLMALYGTGEWVSGFHNGHVYLNSKLIKDKALDAKVVRAEAASFIARMSGVRDVYTIDQIFSGDAGNRSEQLKRNTPLTTSGDILVNIIPGWTVLNDFIDQKATNKSQQVVRVSTTTAPVFILAPNLDPQRIDTPVDVRVVAPTVARLLRIRSPNAASLPSLELER